MQYIVAFATGMCSQLSNISYEIQIFNFGYVSSGHTIFTYAKRVPRVKIFGKHLFIKVFPSILCPVSQI